MRKNFAKFLLLIALSHFSTSALFARAGGGENYNSGSHNTGSSRPSSQPSSSPSYSNSQNYNRPNSTYSSNAAPSGPGSIIALMVVIAGVVIVIKLVGGSSKLGKNAQMYSSRIDPSLKNSEGSASSEKPISVEARVLQNLKSIDSTFDQAAFFGRVQNAFVQVQNAWSKGQVDLIRPFISDGVYERFKIQLHSMAQRGIRNEMHNVNVKGIRFNGYEDDGKFFTVHVATTASARDVTLNSNGETLKQENAQFTEYWSFTKTKTHKTNPQAKGLIEGQCPSCSAPVSHNQSSKCDSCGCMLRSGEFDWVLTEITQVNAEPEKTLNALDLDALRARDQDFCCQLLEDRASVIFWRLIEARRHQKADILANVASAKDAELFTSMGRVDDVGVGSIELSKLILDQKGFDYAVLRIVWSGVEESVGPNGNGSKASRMVVRRKTTASSKKSNELGTNHCQACGSPNTDSSLAKCPACSTPYFDETLWTLVGFESKGSVEIMPS